MKLIITIFLALLLQVGTSVVAQEKKSETTTPVEKPKVPEPVITTTENRIIVSNVPVGSKMQIFSIVGVMVKEIKMLESSGEYTVNLDKGIYIIRIKETETARKFVIR